MKYPGISLCLSVLISFNGLLVAGLWCDRNPTGITVPKTPGDSGYKISIAGDPDRFIPGAVYTVRLQAPGDQFTIEKFSGFLLVAEPADGQSPEASSGNFELAPDSLAIFSEYCPHAVKHASELPKAEMYVRWRAPENPVGCVQFRATVVKNKNQWFMDDGSLTRQLCPEDEDGPEENETLEPCCACDEAKYELTFEGLWSALTHPKDFPANMLSAHFSDVIGASHSPDFSFWLHNEEASDGLQLLAEAGDTQQIETELKEKSNQIRTIIKARGLKNPNFYGHKTFAVFRVDKDHNLVSLVSKIDPSPDWFVGVSGTNLCLPNCSWMEEKTLNLHPWDAGTNDGVTYSIPGDSTYPREKIQRKVWSSDENSPFYDAGGNMVKPFARLRLVKQRSYGSPCETEVKREGYASDFGELDAYDEAAHQNRPECQASPWADWSPCPVTCGRGTQMRYRFYMNQTKAKVWGCNRRLVDRKNCYASTGCKKAPFSYYAAGGRQEQRSEFMEPMRSGYGGASRDTNNDYCTTTEWFPWSQCSATCGRGRRTRERKYLDPRLAREHNCNVPLQQHEICTAEVADCASLEQAQPGCETTQWSVWGHCNVECGQGIKNRTRYYVDNRVSHRHCNLEMVQFMTCTGRRPDCNSPEDPKEICKLPKQNGMCPNSGNHTRWYFDMESLTCKKFTYFSCKGNNNNFRSEKECEARCGALRSELRDQAGFGFGAASTVPIDCIVGEWSEWSHCRRTCGTKTRQILSQEQNGGQPCPALVRTKQCNEDSPSCRAERFQGYHDSRRGTGSYAWGNS